MLDLIFAALSSVWDVICLLAVECWADWMSEPKPYRFCYLGLTGLSFGHAMGASHRQLYTLSAAFYLALYLA